MEDEQIIQLFIARSELAIPSLSDKYHRFCYSIIMKILPDPRDIEECLNDLYLRIWNSIPLDRPHCLSAYLAKITRNIALDRYAYNTAQMRSSELTTTYAELEPYLCIDDSSLITDIDEYSFKEFINHFLRKQSKEARVFFIRRYWYGDSIKQIAAENNISEAKVKTSLFRTRNKLKAALQKENLSL